MRALLTPLLLVTGAPAMAQETGNNAPEVGAIVGMTAAPAAPDDHAADALSDPALMAKARADLAREHGGIQHSFVGFDLAEVQLHRGNAGYRWEGEAWFGGDINRLMIKHEGEGTIGGELEDLEIQALWSHAIDPWWNLQTGIRHDVRPGPQRTYAVVGIDGTAPYWFKLQGALFLSNKGDLQMRAEGHYDQRITERLIAQPRFEANVSAQSVPELGLGRGVSSFELGMRLRYEIQRQFAPYVGIEWQTKVGATARLARLNGEKPSTIQAVAGVSFWF